MVQPWNILSTAVLACGTCGAAIAEPPKPAQYLYAWSGDADEKDSESFGTGGGIQFDRAEWPHGATGKAIVHGTVFSRSAP